jgi:ubiquitin carboxyl-terminal hydrolase 4/11/15
MVGDMSDNDVIVCYELPCGAQQSRTFKRQPDDPLILPVYLCDAKGGQWAYTSRVSLFGYPTVIAIRPDEATDIDTLYGLIMARIVRYTSHHRDLFDWEFVDGSGTPEIHARISSEDVVDVITEFGENGDVVRVENFVEEGDIVEEKAMILDEESREPSTGAAETRYIGPKQDVFSLRLQSGYREFGTSNYGTTITHKWEPWERREELLETCGSLLREGDALYCEFDENKKAYYFGDQFNRFEHARWEAFEEFIHPEYEASIKAAKEKKTKGISLQDCLDEFTKEEKLGEDDLWYCPRCKKHQQATKRFDLWKAPDVLVVHLKRFSNSRTLRDKIDAFIDFPVQDLNLEDMVLERRVAKALQAEGINIEELNLTNLDEPLIYDLFGVDEHIGGLGGGHYRAYALNHANNEWYHFDDSFVRLAKAEDAVVSVNSIMSSLSRFADCLGNRMLMHIFSSTGAGQVSLWEADSRNAFRNIRQKQRNIEIARRCHHLLRTALTPSSPLLATDYLRHRKTTSLLTGVLRPVISLIV